MAKMPNIPALGRTVDPNVRRAIDALRTFFEETRREGGFITSISAADIEGPVKDLLPGGLIDSSIPPKPTGFSVNGAFSTIILTWNSPQYAHYAHTQIWRAEVDDFGQAVKIDTTPALVYSDTPPDNSLSVTYYYWIRFVSKAGIEGPLNATEGTPGSTADDPAYLLELLTGEIKESHLYESLNTRIDKIDTPVTGLLAKAASLKAEVDTINATLSDIQQTPAYDAGTTYPAGTLVSYESGLYRALVETTGNLPTDATYWEKIGDYASLGEAVSGLSAAISDLETRVEDTEGGLAAEVSSREALETQIRGSYAGTDIEQVSSGLIHSERQARSAADTAEAQARETLAATLTGFTDPTGKVLSQISQGLIAEEKSARVSAVEAEAEARTLLAARVTGAEEDLADAFAAISDEAQTRATALEAAAQTTSTLIADVSIDAGISDDIIQAGERVLNACGVVRSMASITEERTVRADADEALAQQIVTISAAMGDAEAAIQTEEQARADGDSAEAQARTTLAATLRQEMGDGDDAAILAAEAYVQDYAYSKVQADDAIAGQVETVQAQISDPVTGLPAAHAAVQTESEARVSTDGLLSAEHTIKVQARAPGQEPVIAGIGLSVEGGASGPITSAVGILANKFFIADPAAAAGDVLPFIVQDGKVYMDTALIRELTADIIKAGTLNADLVNISNLSASKILAGIISAGNIFLGANSRVHLDGANQRIDVTDLNGVLRARFGRLGAGNSNWGIQVWNSAGSLIFSSGSGVPASAVTGLGAFATLSQITNLNVGTYMTSAAIETLMADVAWIGVANITDLVVSGTLNLQDNVVTVAVGAYNAAGGNLSAAIAPQGQPVKIAFSATLVATLDESGNPEGLWSVTLKRGATTIYSQTGSHYGNGDIIFSQNIQDDSGASATYYLTVAGSDGSSHSSLQLTGLKK